MHQFYRLRPTTQTKLNHPDTLLGRRVLGVVTYHKNADVFGLKTLGRAFLKDGE